MLRTDSQNKLPPVMQKKCARHVFNAGGKEFEGEIHSMITKNLTDPKHLLVCELPIQINERDRKPDFWMILPERKLIVHIEAKTCLQDNVKRQHLDNAEPSSKKPPARLVAKEQLNDGLRFSRSICTDDGWHYCKVLATRSESLEKLRLCSKCKPFVFSAKASFIELLKFLETVSEGRVILKY